MRANTWANGRHWVLVHLIISCLNLVVKSAKLEGIIRPKLRNRRVLILPILLFLPILYSMPSGALGSRNEK